MTQKTLNNRILKIAKFTVPGLFLLTTTCFSFFAVDEGNIGIVKRFGEATKQVDPGLHVKIPFVDDVQHMEIRTRKNIEELMASTNEQMPATTSVSVNWTVIKADAFNMYKSYGGLDQFEDRILSPRLRSASKDAIARYKAEEIIQNRNKVITTIETGLFKEMEKFPVKLDSVQIENIAFPEVYMKSIETKQTEKNLADAEKHKLERQKLEAQRAVNTAEAQRDSAKAIADGKAYTILTEAESEAKAIELKGKAEAEAILAKANAIKSNATIVDYTKAKKWNGQMPTTIMGEGQSVLWNMR